MQLDVTESSGVDLMTAMQVECHTRIIPDCYYLEVTGRPGCGPPLSD